MNEPAPEPLPPALVALVAAEKRRAAPSIEHTAHLWQRLQTSVAATGAAAAVPAVAASSAWWLRTLLGFAVGLPSGALLHAAFAPEPPQVAPEIVYVATPAPVVEPAPAPPPPAPPAVAPPAPKRTVAERPASAPRPAAVEPGTLEAERQLLEAARAGLGRGNPAASLVHLERHHREHPDGALSEEREALWVQALAAAGKAEAAGEHARAFRAAYPQSFLLPLVDSASPP